VSDTLEYTILGRYRGEKTAEELDTATGQDQADYLVGEYQLAFGRDWLIWSRPVKGA